MATLLVKLRLLSKLLSVRHLGESIIRPIPFAGAPFPQILGTEHPTAGDILLCSMTSVYAHLSSR